MVKVKKERIAVCARIPSSLWLWEYQGGWWTKREYGWNHPGLLSIVLVEFRRKFLPGISYAYFGWLAASSFTWPWAGDHSNWPTRRSRILCLSARRSYLASFTGTSQIFSNARNWPFLFFSFLKKKISQNASVSCNCNNWCLSELCGNNERFILWENTVCVYNRTRIGKILFFF